MRTGLTLSLLLHLGLIGWAVYSIQATEKFVAPKAPVIEAQLITVGEFTNLRKGDPNAKVMDAKAEKAEDAPPSKKKAEKARPKAAPDLSAPPPPDPIAEKLKAQKAAEEARQKAEAEEKRKAAEAARKKAEAEKKQKAEEARKKAAAEKKRKAEAEKKRKAEAARKKKLAEKRRKEKARKEKERKRKLAEKRRKEKERKRKFDADRIAALLDKTPEKRGSKPVNTREPSKPTDNRGPTAGERDGRGDRLTARESDLLKARIHSQIADCWKLPGGGGGIDTAVVTLRWNLSADGRLNGLPQVIGGRSDTVHRIAAEAAKRAVVCASPFTLPPDSYKFWKTITWDFDPRQML